MKKGEKMTNKAAPLKLPSRYEDLDIAFRGRLKPNKELIELVKDAYTSMQISGGIRFLPIYGESGSGKSSAALEIGTHLPESHVFILPRPVIEKPSELPSVIAKELRSVSGKGKTLLISVIDQYEEVALQKSNIPPEFIESLSLLDRGDLRNTKIIFIWLTTSREFQKSLSNATSRNKRILVKSDFQVIGPERNEWSDIIQETFRFHNDKDLSDYELINEDIIDYIRESETIGDAIECIGAKLSEHVHQLSDLSTYQVIMLWPVTDGQRIARVQQFTDARQGYKLDWNAWYRQLNQADKQGLPLREFNKARLYFDLRLIPIAAADLHQLCKDLDDSSYKLHKSYLERFSQTHFFSILNNTWDPSIYKPLRERDSDRAKEAREWYESITSQPVKIGKRIARILTELGIPSEYERDIKSNYSTVRADVFSVRNNGNPPNVIIEMKIYSPSNTMPSTICEQVRVTLPRHAQFAGFLQKQ